MPPKRKYQPSDSDTDTDPGTGYHPLSDSDSADEDVFSYPKDVLEDAAVDVWESPAIAARVYKKPLGPRKNAGVPRLRPVQETEERIPTTASSFEVEECWNDLDGDADSGLLQTNGDGAPCDPNPVLDAVTPSQLASYRDAVEASVAGYYWIEGTIFVVEGWDSDRQRSSAGWYHLQYIYISGSLHVVCTCPLGIQNRPCVHHELFKSFRIDEELDPEQLVNGTSEALDSTLFLRQQQINSEDEFLSLFSVRSFSSSHLKGRAIVTHVGSSAHTGVWRCSKDSGTSVCVHVRAAHKSLNELLGGEIGELDGVSLMLAFKPRSPIAIDTAPVSYRAILPPVGTGLPSDPILYKRPPPLRGEPPTLLELQSTSTCSCSPGSPLFNPLGPTEVRQCRVFTLTAAFKTSIQLQRCPLCPVVHRRFIGPDLREHGIFNYNNSILVTHDLLDEYTISFVTSETPFTSFVHLVNHRYATTGGSFMGEDLFRSVWFAYATLQALDNDMQCPRSGCQDYPDTIIFDGITLAFGRKHISGTLIPPTTSTASSITRPTIKNHPKQQLIPNASLRKQVRRALDVPDLDSFLSDEDDEGTAPTDEQRGRQANRIRQHFQLLDSIVDALKAENDGLATLFSKVYGGTMLRESVSSVYRHFFLQVAAEESVLQMINGSALNHLRNFLTNPVPGRLTEIIGIPALYNLLKLEAPFVNLIPMVRWMSERATTVLNELKKEKDLAEYPLIQAKKEDWTKTGALYSFPQIRYRPVYPKLATDQQRDVSKPRGDRCGKYYSEYGERRLTGGVMVAWCTHSICYGFHHIPESEGRNDVFSALVTRWPTASKRVVYDFACALGPYCMLREPHFFENTLFVIDHFHARGHTKCSPAAFLSEYANTDPRLVPINSSAAECGNSSLKRIRKSVSYMSQRRAVIYTKVFLSIWNRLRLV